MILLFFTIPVILFAVAIYIISYLKWAENKKEVALATQRTHKVFRDLRVSTVSYGKLKSSMGFEVKAQLILQNDFLIITAQEMNIKLFHTTLPIVLENKQGILKKVKMTNWKTVQIAFQKNTFSLGKANIDLTIEAKNEDLQLEIFNAIKIWSDDGNQEKLVLT